MVCVGKADQLDAMVCHEEAFARPPQQTNAGPRDGPMRGVMMTSTEVLHAEVLNGLEGMRREAMQERQNTGRKMCAEL